MAVTRLLDVNVLLALLWRDHAEHRAVAGWFRSSVESWATCPPTQLGFVRVLSLPTVSKGFVAPADAMELLERNLVDPKHVFWPADIEFVDPVRSTCHRLVGSKQTTDGYLVALAHRYGGKLVTLDRSIPELVRGKPAEGAVELIELPSRPLGVQ
jgi:toxin-antitoxin system PIN domain toxin